MTEFLIWANTPVGLMVLLFVGWIIGWCIGMWLSGRY